MTATVPTTAGMLVPGDRFSMTGATTIFKVEEVRPNPLDRNRLRFTVTTWMGSGSRFTQILPLHSEQELTRWVA